MILYTTSKGDYSIHSVVGLFETTFYSICHLEEIVYEDMLDGWVIIYSMYNLESCFEWLYQHDHISKNEYTSEIQKLKAV